MGCPRIAGVTSSEALGTVSKNKLRGITMGINKAYIKDSLSYLDNLSTITILIKSAQTINDEIIIKLMNVMIIIN